MHHPHHAALTASPLSGAEVLKDADAARSGRGLAHRVVGKVLAADGAGQPRVGVSSLQRANRWRELLEAPRADAVHAGQLRRVVDKVALFVADGARELMLLEVEAKPRDVITLAALRPRLRHDCHLVRHHEPRQRDLGISGSAVPCRPRTKELAMRQEKCAVSGVDLTKIRARPAAMASARIEASNSEV